MVTYGMMGAEGRWWRFWLTLNDGAGWLGMAIIGFLIVSVVSWLAYLRWKNVGTGPNNPTRHEESDRDVETV